MHIDYSIHYKRFHDDSEAHALAMAEWLTIYLRRDLPDDRNTAVLDIGCGFGFTLRALRATGFLNVQGIEISNDQACIARRAGFHVSVVSDTVAYLETHQGRFGLILLLDVLEHVNVQSQIDLVRAARAALQSGGRLIVTVPNANSPLASRWRYIDFTHCSSFTEHSLFFVLRNAGFGRIEMDNNKGLANFPKRWWCRKQWSVLRKWLVRFAWFQVFKAELHPNENLNDICFELNLKAVAFNDATASC